MGVLAGIGILTIFVLSELAAYLKPGSFKNSIQPLPGNDFLKLLMIYSLSLLVLFVNPHGYKTYSYVYSHLNMKMLGDVFEWYSPFSKVFSGTIYQYLYFFFLASSLIAVYYAYKTGNIFIGLVTAVFAVFSSVSSRYTIDFMLIIAILFVISSCGLLNFSKLNFSKLIFSKLNSKAPRLILSAVMLFLIISIANNNLYGYLSYSRSFGFGVGPSDYPVKLFEFIRSNDIHSTGSRPFNSFNTGGYFIWQLKGRKNFIDSRNLSDKIYYDYKTINSRLPGFEKKIDDYSFDYFIWFYPGLVNNSIELQTSITSYLVNSSQKYKLIYWDDSSMLFVKNEEKFNDIISRYEYKFVNPLYYIYQHEPLRKALAENREIVVKEIQRKYKEEPEGSFISSMVRSFKVPVSK
jgi:hypothetical protein